MVNSSQDAEAEAVLAIAERYFDLPNEELELRFEEALYDAESKGLPHRGTTDMSFWRGALVRPKEVSRAAGSRRRGNLRSSPGFSSLIGS